VKNVEADVGRLVTWQEDARICYDHKIVVCRHQRGYEVIIAVRVGFDLVEPFQIIVKLLL
jgi:hypothetical protein